MSGDTQASDYKAFVLVCSLGITGAVGVSLMALAYNLVMA